LTNSIFEDEKSTIDIYAFKLVPFDVGANASANANYIVNGK